MLYLKWNHLELIGIDETGVYSVLTEIDPEGDVVREIGLGNAGEVIYRSPSDDGPLRRGLFDVRVDVGSVDPREGMPRDEFERVWNLAAIDHSRRR